MTAFEVRRNMVMVDSVLCPKRRRLDHIRPSKSPLRSKAETGDSSAGTDLLDIILTTKGNPSSPPPFYSGSPSSRASNPVTRDIQFGIGKPSPTYVPTLLPCAACVGGGCVRTKFGQPAAVTIEGFDFLGGERRNCSISAVD